MGGVPRLNQVLKQRARSMRNEPTGAEQRVWRHLRLSQLEGHKFSRQVPLGGFICDFVCRRQRLIVELDGEQHTQQKDYDAKRTEILEALGYRVIRFWNSEVLSEAEDVVWTILGALREAAPPPGPLPIGAGE